MIEVDTKELFDFIGRTKIKPGSDSCLVFINPSQRALLKDIEDLKFGTVIKMKIQNGLPMEWYKPIRTKFFKALKKIKPSDFDN